MNPTARTYAIHEVQRLTMETMVEALDIEPSRQTYVYLDRDSHLSAVEKPDVHGTPADELLGMGYVWKWGWTR